ncbi:cytochrome P450 [Streptomyces sp. CA-132043]|uniref:cytochrome P450 n=1 Tax=Streptomyces sp. CA-132043 TaxID=3240048 RepID=UPI003D89D6E8
MTGHEAVKAAAKDRRLVHDPRRVEGAGHGIPTRRYPLDGVSVSRHVLSADADDHARLRGLLRPFLTSDAVAQRAPAVRRSVDRALDRFAERGGGDLVADLALPVASEAVAQLLGLPLERTRELVGLSLRLSGPMHPDTPEMAAAATTMNKRLAAVVAHTRRHPGNNLTTALLAAYQEGGVSKNELLGSLSFVLFAAVDSTMTTIPSGVLHLLADTQREARRSLVDGTAQALSVLEDTIRLAAPFTHGVWRFASEPMSLGEYRVEVGDPVVLCFPAANVDPRVWPSAWEVRPDRSGPARHVSFGYGPHFCPGAELGRLQMRTALVELFRRFPDLRLAVDRGELACHANITRPFVTMPVLTDLATAANNTSHHR